MRHFVHQLRSKDRDSLGTRSRRGHLTWSCSLEDFIKKTSPCFCYLGFKTVGLNGRKQRIFPMLKQRNTNLAQEKCLQPRHRRSIITEINLFNCRTVVASVARAVVVVRSVLIDRMIASTVQERWPSLPLLSPFLRRRHFHCFTWIPSHIYCNPPAHRIMVNCHHHLSWTSVAVRSPLRLLLQSSSPKVSIVHRRRVPSRRLATITKMMRISNRNAWPSLDPARDEQHSPVWTCIEFFLLFNVFVIFFLSFVRRL